MPPRIHSLSAPHTRVARGNGEEQNNKKYHVRALTHQEKKKSSIPPPNNTITCLCTCAHDRSLSPIRQTPEPLDECALLKQREHANNTASRGAAAPRHRAWCGTPLRRSRAKVPRPYLTNAESANTTRKASNNTHQEPQATRASALTRDCGVL